MSSKDLMKLALVVILVASAGTASAAGSTITGQVAIGTGGSFAPSANVTIHIFSGSSSYAADSSHLSGNRIYFGNNSDPKMYYSTKDTGSTATLVSSSTDQASSSWSSL